ncbi:proton channel OTOP3 [Xenopus laevis]|uniref:Proton channel OTOP3 n=1 Tax=Xenopus laevis TaxID=8355 RepID=A0A8J0TTC3_XENLA|nr:proton channel OTOP3 [Xenopus laevis]
MASANTDTQVSHADYFVDLEDPTVNYEYSWLHRHCTSRTIHHRRAQKTGRLFSGLIALNLMFMGAALVSSVILSSGAVPERDEQIFLTVFMFFSSVWALYHLLYVRKKKYAVILQDHHTGALWLKASLGLFGLCSVLLAIFKIGHIVLLFHCKYPMDIIFSFMEILFVSVQTILLWVCCKDCIQVHHSITRYGIMLTLSTNMLLWLAAVIDDSLERDLESLQSNATHAIKITEVTEEQAQCPCPTYSLCWTFKKGFVTMYPFNLEYSLICASMLFVMWKNVGRKEEPHAKPPRPRFRLRGVVYGPLLGGAALLVGISIFVQYQVQASAGLVPSLSFQIYYGYNLIILPAMIICSVVGILVYSFREKDKRDHDGKEGKTGNRKCRKYEVNVHGKEHFQNHSAMVEENRKEESLHMEEPVVSDQHWHELDHMGWQNHKNDSIQVHYQDTEYNSGQQKNNQCNQEQNGNSDYNRVEIYHIEQGLRQVKKTDNGLQKKNTSEHAQTVLEWAEHCTEEEVKHNDRHMAAHTGHRFVQRWAAQRHSLTGDISNLQKTHHGSTSKNYAHSLDVTLLLASAVGQFCISYFSIIAIAVTNPWDMLNALSLSQSLFLVIQCLSQTMFIIEGMQDRQEEEKQSPHQQPQNPSRRMSLLEIRRVSLAYLQDTGRLSVSRRVVKETAMFLILCNIMCWIMGAFGAHPLYMNGLERHFYGSTIWLAILNIGLPLSVFYRMHSVGSLIEVYINA